MEEETEIKTCCALRQYYSGNAQMFDSLQITPRLMLCKTSLKLHTPYQQLITVKNVGTHPRLIKFYSDSPEDTQFSVYNIRGCQYLMPSSSFSILVCVKPVKKSGINRSRIVFLECEHPNVKIEIPIIVVQKKMPFAYPPTIEFPSCVPKSWSYYEFIVYNATMNKVPFQIRTNDPSVKAIEVANKILQNNFLRVKLKLFAKNSTPVKGAIKLRFGNILNAVDFSHKPKKVSLYMSTKHISFGQTVFNREVKRTLTICNESKVAIPFKLDFNEELRHSTLSNELLNFASNDSLESSFLALTTAAENPTRKEMQDSISFHITPQEGELPPRSSTEFQVSFEPLFQNYQLNPLDLPPFKMVSELIFHSPLEDIVGEEYLVMEGEVRGPHIDLTPKNIDFRNVYMGEECCERIQVTNADDKLQCTVKYLDYTNSEMAKIIVDPEEGFDIGPGGTGIFSFVFFGIAVGKIYSKIRFSVQNGGYISCVIRATSVPVQVKAHPPVVSFGNVPFGVPQKRSVLLVNPLSTPLSVQLFLKENGSEVPFVLKVDDVNELPPITIQNPIEKYVNFVNEDEVSCYTDVDTDEVEMDNVSGSYHSYRHCDEMTLCSDTFKNEVVDSIPKLAFNLLNAIKVKRIVEKNEAEARVVTEVTDQLLKLPYFKDLVTYNNFGYMDWNYWPSDPIELYFDTEVIHLRPNAGYSVTVLIIPNTVGYFNRTIDVRCCPHTLMCEETAAHKLIIDSELMITRLAVAYTCDIPKLQFHNELFLDDRKIYALQIYDFNMDFKNISSTCGFFHFAVVPDCEDGVMGFRNGIFKFFIAPDMSQRAECQVEFRKIGQISLTGMIKIVGSLLPLPFHISARVHPTEISVHPQSMSRRQMVLEKHHDYFYIENLTPTVTKIKVSLQNEDALVVTPRGAKLGPGQGTYISIIIRYPDPGIYKNVLYMDMLFGTVLKCPLTFNITGVPIFFDPELRESLELGPILMGNEFDYGTRNEMFSKKVRVWNEGERRYCVTFTKLKCKLVSHGHCNVDTIKAHISITPKSIEIGPGEKFEIFITAISCEKVTLYNEFSCTIVDQTYPLRFTTFRFTVIAEFTGAQISWSRKQINMKYDRTHRFDEKQQIEMVKLINGLDAPIKHVVLKSCGPFLIRTIYERPYSKEVTFEMLPLEQKEVWITLDAKKLRERDSQFMKGKIFCYENLKLQKCLPLRVDIKYPDIIITRPDLVYFTSGEEDLIEVQLENVGLLDARFKWKKLGECVNYIAPYDDYRGLAREVLSDILKMLELHEEDDPDKSIICQENLSLCYQKYRCTLAAIEDPDGIAGIVNEIFDNLDLERGRYRVELSSDLRVSEEEQIIESQESGMVVRKTFDEIVNKLKLEDSYEMSEGSLDECEKNEVVYFLEKSGTVAGHQGLRSAVHLPRVRNGYEHSACFVLDVFGGHQQKLIITAVNLERVVDIHPKSIYLGVKPWYESFKVKFKAINSTQYKLNVLVKNLPHQIPGKRRGHYLINGFACVLGSRLFFINPYSSNLIGSQGILGFSSEFIRDFQLTANDCFHTKFSLRGQGIMPILLALRINLPRTIQEKHVIIKEYQLLQQIYYFHMFKDITFEDDEKESVICENEEEIDTKSAISFSKISIFSVSGDSDEKDSDLEQRVNRNWDLLLSTYVVVFNNESLPHASILDQLLATERFIDDVHRDSSKRNLLQRLYRNHCIAQARIDPKIPVNLKYFTVQPLPFEQRGYVIEMSNLKLGQFRKYDIDLKFFGPGKLTACARTTIRIPCLYLHFQIMSEKTGVEFSTYRADDKSPDFYSKCYRNMHERECDFQGDPKLAHAHSYDCEERCKFHKRDVTLQDRTEVRNYYNSLNKSAHDDYKHHFINCMIYSLGKQNNSGTILRLNVLIKADPKYYKLGQVFNDFVYIDLHMGPTLPILLLGTIS